MCHGVGACSERWTSIDSTNSWAMNAASSARRQYKLSPVPSSPGVELEKRLRRVMAASRIASSRRLCVRYQFFFYIAILMLGLQLFLGYSFYSSINIKDADQFDRSDPGDRPPRKLSFDIRQDSQADSHGKQPVSVLNLACFKINVFLYPCTLSWQLGAHTGDSR